MEQADKKQRSFLNRWWILIVIVLWLIAWSARDVLAPSVEAVPEGDDVEAVAVADDEPAAAGSGTDADRPREGRLSEGDMDPMTGEPYELDDGNDMHRPIPDPREQPRTTASGEPVSEEQVARQVQEALEAGRAAYWSEGPEAAAAILRTALDEIPATSSQRADLYGELGNALYAAGDARGAMRAWDSALDLLPGGERRAMIDRLAPVYDRHHRDGARHLRQYR
ncbi:MULTISPECIES: hypothetical protein [unclassified Thioalkalivibrio]|uniref:hypothetical protein n=1 Tax=unclassified Thioalkalivibrio TaxID=2621013 RepID=UPI00037D819E|nr:MULTISPECIES: hypothetical protein [unclassified Thioalkalivibrio]